MRGLHLAITRALGAWSCHWEVSLEKSHHPSSPTRPSVSTGAPSVASKDQSHMQRCSQHMVPSPEVTERSPRRLGIFKSPVRPRVHSWILPLLRRVLWERESICPRRASNSLKNALHCLSPNAPGDSQQEEEMPLAWATQIHQLSNTLSLPLRS